MLPKISIATSVRYGKYKEYFDDALFMTESIINNYNAITDFINLPRDLSIHLRPIRNGLGKAFYYFNTEKKVKEKVFCVELDIRQGDEDFYDTLLHELVHVEQFYEGRLQDPYVKDHFKWNDDMYCFRGLDINEYMSLPWETEAVLRAINLRSIIFK
jgi:hypothetical protein